MKSIATFMVALLVAMEYSATMGFAGRASVSIHNVVGQDIQVNCPGHNAFGQMTMLPNQYFGWDFKPNQWGTTRYTCSFRWGLKWRQFYVFVDDGVLGYVKRRPCMHCVWWVGRAGFWMTDLYEKPEIGIGGSDHQDVAKVYVVNAKFCTVDKQTFVD